MFRDVGSIVKTPLWTNDLETSARYGYRDEISITPESVAQAELKLIKDGQYAGGTIYEISLAGERVVPAWNISPPGFDSDNPTQGISVPQEALDRSYEPILAVLDQERKST